MIRKDLMSCLHHHNVVVLARWLFEASSTPLSLFSATKEQKEIPSK